MRKNAKGFGIFEVLMIVAVIGLIIVTGWLVIDRQTNNKHTNSTPQEETENNENQELANDAENEYSNEYFDITLPEGWNEDSTKEVPAGAPEAYYYYENGSGKSVAVSVNSGGFGGAGSGTALFTIDGNEVLLDDEFSPCDPETDRTGGCSYGDGELRLIVTSSQVSEEYNGNSYMFWLADSQSENQDSYKELAEIIETIKLK